MRKFLISFGVLLFGAANARAVNYPPYHGDSAPAAGVVTEYLSGTVCVAASSATAGTCAVTVSGPTATVTATTFTGTISNAVQASSSTHANDATVLQVTPSKCSVGNYPLGVDKAGNAQNCTAAGVGDVTQAGNNTFVGTNIFSGSVTLGYTTVTSTANFSAVVAGQWSVVASTHPVAATAIYFYNIVSTASVISASCTSNPIYEMRGMMTQNTASGSWNVRYSGSQAGAPDATANNYGYASQGESNVGSLNNNGSAAFSFLDYVSQPQIPSGGIGKFEYKFWPLPGANNKVMSDSHFAGHMNTNLLYGGWDTVSTLWPGGTGNTNIGPLSYIQLYDTAGTFTGDVSLWVFCTK